LLAIASIMGPAVQNVVIAISNSGNTRELCKATIAIKEHGAQLIAVTGNRASELSHLADLVINAPVEQEGGVLGLAPRMVQSMLNAVAEINRAGTMVLLAEQNAYAALSIAHRGYVLANGRVVLEGSASTLQQNELVKKAFIGA